MPDVMGRDRFERLIARAFKKVGDRFVDDLLKALGDPPHLTNVPDSFWKRYGAELRAGLNPVLAQIYQAAAEQLVTDSGISWTLPNEAAAMWAQNYSYHLVTGIENSTKTKLQGYISDYFRTQRTMGELRAEIKPNIKDLLTRAGRLLTSEKRAQLIATTEVTRASVQGELSIAQDVQDSGFELVPVWQTNHDDLVCPLCGPRNGKKQGDGWDEPPPAHPGCRCWLNHDVRKQGNK